MLENMKIHIQSKLQIAQTTKEDTLRTWLSHSQIAESAWSYLGKIARAEMEIQIWTHLLGAIDHCATKEDFVEVLNRLKFTLLSQIRMPSSSNGISNAIESVQMDVRLDWVKSELEWLEARASK
jgi:hypothetical protein